VSLEQDKKRIRLVGQCRLEEAEPLASLLEDTYRPLDLSGCTGMHAAVLQVLLSYSVTVTAPPQDPFLRDFIFPGLGQPGLAVEG
jgi:hypothetical protein